MNIARRSLLAAAGFTTLPQPILAASKTIDWQSEINRAIQTGGVVGLPAGRIAISGLKINGRVWLQGVPGHTELVSSDGGPILHISDAQDITLSGISFRGKTVPSTDDLENSGLVVAQAATNLNIEACTFSGSPFSGLRLFSCSGRISNSTFHTLGITGIFAFDSRGLIISNNDVFEIGNNGIQVWRSEVGADGSQVLGNYVHSIRADAGGDGQNGNGINIYRASNVISANNRVHDVAFSGIRYNSGSNAQIFGNSLSRCGEVALFVEFSYEGAVVANNLIDNATWGISITNYDVGGRLATCTGNVVRNIHGGMSEGAGEACGIIAEADTAINSNVLDDIKGIGIRLGWGPFARNLMAQGNIIRTCGRGIVVSTTPGAGPQMVTGNMISEAKLGAIVGMDHNEVTLEDFAVAPGNLRVSNNSVTI